MELIYKYSWGWGGREQTFTLTASVASEVVDLRTSWLLGLSPTTLPLVVFLSGDVGIVPRTSRSSPAWRAV